MKCKAAILRGVGVDWEVAEIDLDPPRAGEVLVRMAYAGVCHSDEHFYSGDSVPSEDMEAMMRLPACQCPNGFPCSAVTRARASSRRSVPESLPSNLVTTSRSRSSLRAATAAGASRGIPTCATSGLISTART